MAKSFTYPVVLPSSITDGVMDEATNGSTSYDFNDAATPGDNVTNRNRSSDQSIGSAISNFGADDVLRIDLGSSFACDALAIYVSSTTNNNIELYFGNDDGVDMGTDVTQPTLTKTSQPAGWSIGTFTEETKRYWFVRSADGDVDLSEMFVGQTYDFPVNFELQNTIGELDGADTQQSDGGAEYSVQRHSPKTTWNWQWKFIKCGTQNRS